MTLSSSVIGFSYSREDYPMHRFVAVLSVTSLWALLSCGYLAAQGLNVSPPTDLPVGEDSVPRNVWASSAADDADRLLVCTTEQDSRHGRNPSVAYVSFNGGDTWIRSLVDLGSWGWVTETACAADTDGRAYFVGSASGKPSDAVTHHSSGSTRVFRSSDGGMSWSIVQRLPFIDWNLLAIDQVRTGATHPMFLFGNGMARGVGDAGSGEFQDERQPLLVGNDADTAGFSAPRYPLIDGRVAHLDSKKAVLTVPIDAVVLNDGTALVLYSDADTPSTVVTVYYANANSYGRVSVIDAPDGYRPAGGLSGQIAYDRELGTLYVSYVATKVSEDILVLARSQDNGKTWQNNILVRKVNGASPDQREHMPTTSGVAVNKEGIVGVQWLPLLGCPVFGLSTDHGKSLSASRVLGDCVDGQGSNPASAQTELIEPFSVFHIKTHWNQGDTSAVDRSNEALGFEMRVNTYDASAEKWNKSPLFGSQVVADARGNFHAFWTELGKSGRVRLLTSSIDLTAPRPHVDLRSAKDLTEQVVMNIIEQRYDTTTATFDVDAAVRNKSTTEIAYPEVLVVLADRSECGRISYLNSYGISEDGDILYRVPRPPFQSYLVPGESSQPIHFQIRITGCESARTDLVQAALNDANLRRPARSLGYFPLAVRFRALVTTNVSVN